VFRLHNPLWTQLSFTHFQVLLCNFLYLLSHTQIHSCHILASVISCSASIESCQAYTHNLISKLPNLYVQLPLSHVLLPLSHNQPIVSWSAYYLMFSFCTGISCSASKISSSASRISFPSPRAHNGTSRKPSCYLEMWKKTEGSRISEIVIGQEWDVEK